MKKSQWSFLMLTAISLSVMTLIISFQVQTVKVTGTWNMAVQTSQGSGNPVLVLKQAGDTLITGTYTGQFGEAPLKGTVKADKIYLQISASDLTMEYIGTVDGNSMRGKVKFGSYGEGTFTGKKKQE